jgi:pimeloyl-ACP methyl ester carboxylesterase
VASTQSVTLAGALERFAAALDDQAAEQRRASLGQPGRHLRWADVRGDGRAVTVVGDHGSAPVLVVLVPGVGTDLADLPSLERRAARLWAELAVASTRSGFGQDHVAVAAWLGYDPPDHLLGGLRSAPADRGARALTRDLADWRREGVRRVVVVGHSYGALVAARAAAGGAAPDELVMLGAPGLGVTDLGSLRLPPGADLWAAVAELDPIGWAARTGLVHGPDPAGLARRLRTRATGHGDYLEDPELLRALTGLALHDPRPAGTVATWVSP